MSRAEPTSLIVDRTQPHRPTPTAPSLNPPPLAVRPLSAQTPAMTLTVTVKYFASIRETIGTGQEVVASTAATVGALRDELLARGGAHAEALARGRAVRAAVNQVMGDEATALPPGAEVAFFPPVTGG